MRSYGNIAYPGISVIAGTLTLSGAMKDGVRPGGSTAQTGFHPRAGDLVLTGTSPNTFTNFIRPFGTRIIIEKDAALGTGNATNATISAAS